MFRVFLEAYFSAEFITFRKFVRFQALKPTAKITHKGEIEIERFDETFDRTNEFNNSAREETENEAKEETVKMETASEKSALPKKETSISAAEKETINRMISKSAKVKTDSVDVLADPTPADASIGGGESPKTPDYVYNPESPDEGPLSDMEALPESPPMLSPGAPSLDQSEEASSADTKSENSSTMSKVWSGKLVFTEASTFRANAYVISGNLSSSALKSAVPKQMAVAGKIDYKTVGEVSSLQIKNWWKLNKKLKKIYTTPFVTFPSINLPLFLKNIGKIPMIVTLRHRP